MVSVVVCFRSSCDISEVEYSLSASNDNLMTGFQFLKVKDAVVEYFARNAGDSADPVAACPKE